MPSTPPTLVALLLAASTASAAITIPTVSVGDAGNDPDPSTGGKYGDVAYEYHIGKYEVTNSQYTAFLNAVAKTDEYGLFKDNLTDYDITRGGTNGNFSYSTSEGNKPVSSVTFWDAARFANWLTNGQPTGSQDNNTTEDGMYTLVGGADPENSSVTRNLDFSIGDNGVAVASEDEWYKAAYYDGSGGYYDYPTQSNTEPTSQNPPGGTNSANYNRPDSGKTNVGAYIKSKSYYETFDQAGNLSEWTDTLDEDIAPRRTTRGSSWFSTSIRTSEFSESNFYPDQGGSNIGFRVTSLTAIPEPSSYGAIFGIVGLATAVFFRRRRRRE